MLIALTTLGAVAYAAAARKVYRMSARDIPPRYLPNFVGEDSIPSWRIALAHAICIAGGVIWPVTLFATLAAVAQKES